MPAPIIPWNPSNIPIEVQSELNRRKVNRGFSYTPNQNGNWNSNDGEWNTYRGPMTSWVRMCSNSNGPVDKMGFAKKPRFVLHSGKGFYQSYGFSNGDTTNANEQIIGYTPGDNSQFGEDGVPHVIENTLITPKNGNFPIHVPPPEISRIEVVVQKELFRRATVEWVCFSWKQLEYMAPYFLVPGITVMLEWGWNHFNPISLVPLYDVGEMQSLWKNAYSLYANNIMYSKGNYDVIYGIISNFNWSMEGNKIICSTEISSKDRIYSGIAKDTTLTVKSNDKNEPDKIFQSIKDFLSKDDTIRTIKNLAASPNPADELTKLSGHNPDYLVWKDIIGPLLYDGTPETKAMRIPYVHGVFSGRPKDFYGRFGNPEDGDFDKGVQDKDPDNLWINMGLVVQILNHFSKMPGSNGEPMFVMDIQNSIVGGHPNMVSCDKKVLIPNYQAPKFHYGFLGMQKHGFKGLKESNWFNYSTIGKTDAQLSQMAMTEYGNQYVKPISLSVSGSLSNEQLSKICYQKSLEKSCYKSNLDAVVNMMRNAYSLKGNAPQSWSFPASEDFKLSKSLYGLPGGHIETNRSGLLSNVYLNYSAFKKSVENGASSLQINTAFFMDVYKDILQILMDAVAGFWDLAVVEVNNKMTITDRKYVGNIQSSNTDPMYVFDYYDSDSIIKSIKFRPLLSDAVAIRSMFAESSNKDAKYSISSDKDDSINFKYKDAINFNDKSRTQGDSLSDMEKATTAKQQMADLISSVQKINDKSDDGSLNDV